MARRNDGHQSRTGSGARVVIPSWASLNESERQRVLVARAFLASRLAERGTLDWALRLEPHRHAERFTIDDLLNGRPVPTIKEPYAIAWRLIEESWAHVGTDRRPSFTVHNIRKRLREGERSPALVSEIANLLAPRLEVKPLEDRPWGPIKRRNPRRFNDLLAASLTSVSIHRDFGSRGREIGLAEVCDVPFPYGRSKRPHGCSGPRTSHCLPHLRQG